MNARNKVINHLENMKEVGSIQVRGEVPMADGRYLIQVNVYLKPEQKAPPPPLGVVARETIKTKDSVR